MTLDQDKITGVLRVSGKLGIDGAESLREALLDCLHQQREVVADLSEANGCDTAVLQVLLASGELKATVQMQINLVDTFLPEADDSLAEIEASALSMNSDPSGSEAVNRIFRALT